MPMLTINTNVPESQISDNFITELSSMVAELLGKPEMYVCVQVNAGQRMTFNGTSNPCAMCSLTSIGKIGLEENKKATTVLMKKFNSDLKIEPNRMYISFIDMARQDVGWNMKTFAN